MNCKLSGWHKGLALILVLTLAFLFPTPAPQAQEPVEVSEPRAFYHPALIRPGFRGGSGELSGFLEYFLPVVQHERALPFINYRGNLIDGGASEHNLGGGYRHLFGKDLLIAGANVYWDSRYSVHNNRFNQLGFGFEALTKWVDLRSNIYIALSDEEIIESASTSSFKFASTSINRISSTTFEEPLTGFDYEGGVLVPIISRWLETRVYAGGFYYDSDLGKNLYGFRGRADFYPSPLFTVQLKIENNNQSGTDFFAGGYISIPFELGNLVRLKNPFQGAKERFRFGKGARSMRERMTEPVARDSDIVTEEHSETKEEVVVPNVIYVDNRNDGDAAESGTLEHPHNTLLEGFANPRYGPGATIYTRAGDGTSVGYEDSYTLTSRTVLWGQGFQMFPGIGGGPAPKIDCMGANPCVTMGMNTELMGFTIDPGVNGVGALNVSGVNIHHNTIMGHTMFGVIIANTDGGVHTGFTITGNTITGNGYSGIGLYNSGGSTTSGFTANGNTITGNTYSGIFVRTEDDATSMDFTFTGNTMTGNGSDGALVRTDNSSTSMDFTFTNNTVTDNDDDGIAVDTDNSSTARDFTFTGNTINDNGDYGIYVGTTDDSTSRDFTFTGNTINDNGESGVYVYTENSAGVHDFTFTGNTINDNGDHGIYLHGDADDDHTEFTDFTFIGNTITGNSGDGVYVYLEEDDSGADATDFTFTNNTISMNGGNGIHFNLDDQEDSGSEVNDWTFTGNTITGNAYNGIYIRTSDVDDFADFGDWLFTGNTITGNGTAGPGYAGIRVEGDDLDIDDWDFFNNVITGNSGDGVHLDGSGSSSSGDFTFTGNSIFANGAGYYDIYNDRTDFDAPGNFWGGGACNNGGGNTTTCSTFLTTDPN